ncbi:putative metal-binding motif-containing protein [Lacinutrix sp. C3R15]|uniref:putative metal-binding motif-containing protein n=1 Tax=Flavobacteriaceae TaxID=49546 RepID=UPI001C08B0A7|nr:MULTISPECIES: putative metal-binding motif-containing protein [Flavobacteriaceae]MBU2938773.1 putative metal-binding motif-containing protein [Lacinutrix sp. C3R15]MDO6622086.1 putative metal-binding motif-containing protein [Oceanihabitans sp. 1_MG-2023]
MKKHIIQTVLPVMLLLIAVFFIGAGCTGTDPDGQSWYLDNDGDGYGTIEDINWHAPPQPAGYADNSNDCDDTDATIHPEATEVPDNDIDENCNGLFGITFYKDVDGDGFGDFNESAVYEVNFGDTPPDGMVYNNADCDDANAMINPKADEILGNNIDDNCDGDTDILEYYKDEDGDGYGAGSVLPPPAVGVHNNLDCNDANPEVYPYAIEVENGVDDDCDGITDELF